MISYETIDKGYLWSTRRQQLKKSTNDQPWENCWRVAYTWSAWDRIDKEYKRSGRWQLINSVNGQLASLIFFIHRYFVPFSIQRLYVAVKLLAETALLLGDNICSVKYGPSLLLWELRKQRWLNLLCWCNCCGKLHTMHAIRSDCILVSCENMEKKIICASENKWGSLFNTLLHYSAVQVKLKRWLFSGCICVIRLTYRWQNNVNWAEFFPYCVLFSTDENIVETYCVRTVNREEKAYISC
jgi:hypothetical protein